VTDFTPNGRLRGRVNGATLVGGEQAVALPSTVIPRLINLNWMPIIEGSYLSSRSQVLDGLDCRGCVLENSHFIYSGGPFNFSNTTIRGSVSIEYRGAAANTIAMIDFVKGLGLGQSTETQPAGQPIQRKTDIKPQPKKKFDFSPPFVSGN
jgi:hypothetical protein